MSLTGELIKFGGIAGLAVGSTVSLFLLSRVFEFFYRFNDLEEEFENMWKDPMEAEYHDQDLANLSYVHRATRRQMDSLGDVDWHLLEGAIKKARRNKGIVKGRDQQMYYIAHEKLENLKRDAKQAGKL